jgi:hypothetical protein
VVDRRRLSLVALGWLTAVTGLLAGLAFANLGGRAARAHLRDRRRRRCSGPRSRRSPTSCARRDPVRGIAERHLDERGARRGSGDRRARRRERGRWRDVRAERRVVPRRVARSPALAPRATRAKASARRDLRRDAGGDALCAPQPGAAHRARAHRHVRAAG